MQDKSILITGATGFLGKCLVSELENNGYTNLIKLGGHTECDLRNSYEVSSLLSTYRPEVVIHLAARVGGIWDNKEKPGTFIYDNLSMGINLIEASRRFGVEKFVLLSTVCSYPKFTPVPFIEDDLWNGYPEETNAPYGIAKKTLMEMLNAYRKQYGFNGITLIPSNLYGPNFGEDTHVIPQLIRKIARSKEMPGFPLIIGGTGRASREFLYVEDCARAIRLAMEKYDKPEPVNIGCGESCTISEVVSLLTGKMQYWGNISWDANFPDGQPKRKLDVGRAEREFGFVSEVGLSEGLDRVLEWYNGVH